MTRRRVPWPESDPQFPVLDRRREELSRLMKLSTDEEYRHWAGLILLALRKFGRDRETLAPPPSAHDRKQELRQSAHDRKEELRHTAASLTRAAAFLRRNRARKASFAMLLEVSRQRRYGSGYRWGPTLDGSPVDHLATDLEGLAHEAARMAEEPQRIHPAFWLDTPGLDYVSRLWPTLFNLWNTRHGGVRYSEGGPLERFVCLVHEIGEVEPFSSATLKAAARKHRQGSKRVPKFLLE